MKFKPVIKWSGSKRGQSEQIVSHFPKIIKTYYEPFCGSCSVLYQLLNTPNIKVNRYVCSDINDDLIVLWKIIQKYPLGLYDKYKREWDELNALPNIESKNEYYYKVRDRFNEYKSSFDFFFLIRTCFNGLIRYNKKLEFNSPFHFSRPGIHPDKIKLILMEWSDKIQNVEFKCCSYDKICGEQGDFMYLDSPYFSTKAMYNGKIDYVEYFNWLRKQKCNYVFSFDGKSGENNFTHNVPMDIYNKHYYMNKEISSYRRLNKEINYVQESLYIKSKQYETR